MVEPLLYCDHTRVLCRTVYRELSLHQTFFARIRSASHKNAVKFRRVSPCLNCVPLCAHKAFRKHHPAYAGSAGIAISCMMVGTTTVHISDQHLAERVPVQVVRPTVRELDSMDTDIYSTSSVGPHPHRRHHDHTTRSSNHLQGLESVKALEPQS